MGEEKRDEEEGKKEGRERERKGNKVREEMRKRKKRAMRVFLSSSSSSLSVALLLLLSPNLHPLISSPSPSLPLFLPPSLVLPRRLFVCTSIIPGDKRRPFHRSHANLKPDTLSFLFSFQISPFFFSCETSGYNDR